ncbi:MAG: tetratricopeptide repeat protein [Prevotella sp.]|nr:tetratricopeptide repeat protein [Prevotella sp.]
MDIAELIKNPQYLDRDTLYELRSVLALYPYFQTARILLLQNLYLLHDPMFDAELRQAAIYITDRRVLFQMIEAAHYRLRTPQVQAKKTDNPEERENRTISLIDTFLDSIPKDAETAKPGAKRKPTMADAAVDYVAYLLESETDDDAPDNVPQLIGQDLIDTFINSDKGKIVLPEEPQLKPQVDTEDENAEKEAEEGVFTETLARIYIKQGRYSKALEIIKRLSLQYPKKNAYFADQIRFLEKLIINNNKKNK